MTQDAGESFKDLLLRAANTELPKSPEPPKGGIKRFLTPSPVGLSSSTAASKRTRQVGEDLFGFDSMADEEANSVGTGEIVMETHYLTKPMDPSDITVIATELKQIMLPELGAMIREYIPDIRSIVNEAVKTMSETFRNEMATIKKENTSLRQENKALKKTVSELKIKVTNVEIAADSNEQYSRRNNLRITGIPVVNDENTDDILLKFANDVGVNIDKTDIDRSHRVGPVRGGQRALLVKFTTYRARQQLYAIRKDLRKSEYLKGIFLNEDMTARRSKLLYSARKLVRARKLKAAYTGDGKIFLRDNDDNKHHITSENDLIPFENAEARPADDDEDQWDDAVGETSA